LTQKQYAFVDEADFDIVHLIGHFDSPEKASLAREKFLKNQRKP
jgi:hypothetical protein